MKNLIDIFLKTLSFESMTIAKLQASILNLIVGMMRGIQCVPENYQAVRCIKTLTKSTYKGSAFKKGHTYFIQNEEPTLIFVIDEMGYPFSFSTSDTNKTLYRFSDYFISRSK